MPEKQRSMSAPALPLRPLGQAKEDTMTTATTIDAPAAGSKPMRYAGWTLTGLFTAFMLFDIGMKLAQAPIVEETGRQMRLPPNSGFGIGVMEAVILALYLFPRTSVLGAVLVTGLMGGTA